MSIMHITMACGFQSACHFSKSYRDTFGVAPTRERRKQVAPLAQGWLRPGRRFRYMRFMREVGAVR
ncbi:AraC family transcriptional regulator [Burkholderia latens]|uniref:AraC family transcriptional regulator n=1 Tax=Burkholderia latens TaxID=488446 RepID=A0A6P2GNK5_9BURK|nr:AraC family transcriptional regulator [Burkholderia latens]